MLTFEGKDIRHNNNKATESKGVRYAVRSCVKVAVRSCLPLQVVDLVGVLSLLSIIVLIGLVDQHLHAFSSTRLILAGLCYCIQLTHLVLEGQKRMSMVIVVNRYIYTIMNSLNFLILSNVLVPCSEPKLHTNLCGGLKEVSKEKLIKSEILEGITL